MSSVGSNDSLKQEQLSNSKVPGCAESFVRGKQLFVEGWQFCLTDSVERPDAVSWRAVTLPHDWCVEEPVSPDAPSCGSGGYARTGIGWYTKEFRLQQEPGSQYVLLFDGVMMNCDLWLNDAHLGKHIYGYTPFEADITRYLAEGTNKLFVRVDNSRQPASRWYTGCGITRNVYLERRNTIHIARNSLYITTLFSDAGQALVLISLDVNGLEQSQDAEILYRIFTPEGTEIASERAVVHAEKACGFTKDIALDKPVLWDIDNPYLYRAEIEIRQNSMPLDALSERFGVRRIGFDAKQGFLLNGRKRIFKGVCLHHDGGCVGAAVPLPVWKRRLLKLKEMGANAVRFSHNPPDPELLDLTDELGFVVLDEAFDEWQIVKPKAYGSNTHESKGYSEWFNTCWEKDLSAMLRRDRNHPSVVMWSIGNEVPEQVTPNGAELARRLKGVCCALDPTRPVTQACDQLRAEPQRATEAFLAELDVVGVNYADRWRERAETFFSEEKDAHPDYLLFGSEDCAVNGKRGDYRLQTETSVWGPTPYYARMLKPERLWKFIRIHPYVMGSFMWTGVDYLGECNWPDKSSSAGVMDTCGFEKDGYYFYQSIWTDDKPVLHACPHRNLPYPDGTIIPLVVYTNCFSCELFVGGISYGTKAYEFPTKGMSEYWGHFEGKPAPVTTSDLHLTWDIPCGKKEVVVIGRNEDGVEVARKVLRPAGKPDHLRIASYVDEYHGKNYIQLEISLVDKDENLVPDQDIQLSVRVINGKLLGMDNGKPDDHTLYQCGYRSTWLGKLYVILVAEPGQEKVQIDLKSSDDKIHETLDFTVG